GLAKTGGKMVDFDQFVLALSHGARAFADTIDAAGPSATAGGIPKAGSAKSMSEVLAEVARINDQEKRGVNRTDIREIAKTAGMDVSGTAGYFHAELLEMKVDGRWITTVGRARLKQLG